MMTWHNELPFDFSNPTINGLFTEQTLFFDIETTGFSPDRSTLYLIGCAARKGHLLIIDQFFAETPEQQNEILTAFLALLSDYDTVITFNGQGFDIPYLKAKCRSLQQKNPDPFAGKNSIDIFKTASGLKSFLNLPDCKQKTIEQFLGIPREDIYSGGELIPVYHNYTKTPSTETRSLLRQHNYEDVFHMPYLLPLFAYRSLREGNFTIHSITADEYTTMEGTSDGRELFFTLQLSAPVPKRISCSCDDFYLMAENNTTHIRIRLFEGELKYFFDNPSDYYYLPAEDTALHKSIAASVAKEHRKKATASTCYTRKYAIFLPQHKEIQKPVFKQERKEKKTYFELTEEFVTSEPTQKQYILHILDHLLSRKNKHISHDTKQQTNHMLHKSTPADK